jgi:hypothetical protein
MITHHPKIVQIAASSPADGPNNTFNPVLYALDESGRIWAIARPLGSSNPTWHLLEGPRAVDEGEGGT